MIASDTPVNPELLVLSIGFGSLFLSHLNDGGFWIVSEGLGLNVRQMLQSWTIVESIIGVVGLLLTLLANACLTRLPIAVILTVGGMARALKLFYIKLLYPMASY